jgi:hypothetical protein
VVLWYVVTVCSSGSMVCYGGLHLQAQVHIPASTARAWCFKGIVA